MTDYSTYILSRRERTLYYAAACLLLGSLGMLFYRSLLLALPLLGLSVPLERMYTSYRAKKRRLALLEGFRDALYGISAGVAAGRQMPFAIAEAARAVKASHGEGSDIARELEAIAAGYRSVHGDALAMLSDLGKRSGLPEIGQFASSCSICASCGGDLEAISLRSAEVLLGKIALRQETDSLLAQKKLDIAVLGSLPLLMLLFLNLVSSDYLSVLYKGLAGRAIMTLCLAALGGAAWWSWRILDENT